MALLNRIGLRQFPWGTAARWLMELEMSGGRLAKEFACLGGSAPVDGLCARPNCAVTTVKAELVSIDRAFFQNWTNRRERQRVIETPGNTGDLVRRQSRGVEKCLLWHGRA
jgi:hypothetical protein